MKTFKQYLSEMKKPRYEIPAEPGSTPTPEGKVKLYHQTDGRNISSIRKKGIESRQPVEGPKGIYASKPDKSSGRGFYGHPNDTPTIEFHVDKDEYSAPFVHRDKVEPKKIVAAHKPWHSTVRYIDADPDLRRDIENDKDGEYSRMIKDPNNKGDKTTRGVRFVMKRSKAQKIAEQTQDDDYRGDHRAPGPEEGSPLHDVTKNGTYPEDVYSHNGFRYYHDHGNSYDRESHRKLLQFRNKPDDRVWIHRAIPEDVYHEAMKKDAPLSHMIRRGDWVSISKEYAKDHGENRFKGKYKIASRRVPASHIYTNGDSVHEWGYHPPED